AAQVEDHEVVAGAVHLGESQRGRGGGWAGGHRSAAVAVVLRQRFGFDRRFGVVDRLGGGFARVGRGLVRRGVAGRCVGCGIRFVRGDGRLGFIRRFGQDERSLVAAAGQGQRGGDREQAQARGVHGRSVAAPARGAKAV